MRPSGRGGGGQDRGGVARRAAREGGGGVCDERARVERVFFGMRERIWAFWRVPGTQHIIMAGRGKTRGETRGERSLLRETYIVGRRLGMQRLLPSVLLRRNQLQGNRFCVSRCRSIGSGVGPRQG